jgi:hemolysin III
MVTHGLAALLSVVALAIMVRVANGEFYRTISAVVFGGSLVMLYSSSAAYHAISGHRLKVFFRSLDHVCIYLLIAGSYTPLTLVSLRGPWGWTLLGIIWFLTLAGVLIKSLCRTNQAAWWSTALYLLMGWLVVVAAGPVVRVLPAAALAWLVAGGVCYTLGVVFFVWRNLRFSHAVWHLFVMAGSACHVVATTRYILA